MVRWREVMSEVPFANDRASVSSTNLLALTGRWSQNRSLVLHWTSMHVGVAVRVTWSLFIGRRGRLFATLL